MYDMYDRWFLGGLMLMFMSPILVFIGLLSFLNPNFEGTFVASFVCIIGVFLFLFGVFIFYIGKVGIAKREAEEQKRLQEKEELAYLRKRVKKLEEGDF
ncbi:MAG: hypothetical protein ACFFDC_17330 [Promethearchaeota archaeon]